MVALFSYMRYTGDIRIKDKVQYMTTPWQKSNSVRFLKLWRVQRNQPQPRKLIVSNGFMVCIEGTAFAAQWFGSESSTDNFELLTNFGKDGIWTPLRRPFSGTLAQCLDKANKVTDYYNK